MARASHRLFKIIYDPGVSHKQQNSTVKIFVVHSSEEMCMALFFCNLQPLQEEEKNAKRGRNLPETLEKVVSKDRHV